MAEDSYVLMPGPNGAIKMKVTDNGDGTFSFPSGVTATVGEMTANAGTNLNTSLLALEQGGNLADIKADVDKIPSKGQAVAANSMPVVLPAAQITTLTPPAALTNFSLETGGNLAAILAKLTSDPATQTTLAAILALLPTALAAHGGLKVEGVASGVAQPVSGTFWQTIQPSSDAGPSWTTIRGVGGLPFSSADQHSAPASVTDAPTAGQKLVITDLIVSVDTAMSVTFKEETTGTVMAGPYYMAANTVLQLTPRGKFKLTTADKKLQVLTSVAGNITVSAYSFSEA